MKVVCYCGKTAEIIDDGKEGIVSTMDDRILNWSNDKLKNAIDFYTEILEVKKQIVLDARQKREQLKSYR